MTVENFWEIIGKSWSDAPKLEQNGSVISKLKNKI